MDNNSMNNNQDNNQNNGQNFNGQNQNNGQYYNNGQNFNQNYNGQPNGGYKRLMKSRNNRMICGVCGGLGEYLNVDPVLIRIGAVVIACCAGLGVLAYIIAAICMPEQ